jgi:SulP family sulfate permease
MKDSDGHIVGRLKGFLWDLSGAFGDIGVLFPLAVALIAKNGFNPTALFLLAGLFSIASAAYFKITMPVQPLKAMSAIAIATGLGVHVINAAGIAMGAILLMIAITGISVRLGTLFPVSVIRGIQLGLGLMLIRTSSKLIAADGATALIAGALLAVSLFLVKKLPPLIPLLLLGVIAALKGITPVVTGPVAMVPRLPDVSTLVSGFTLLVLPQLGLTFGNAIVATEATGKLLYGDRARRLTLTSIPVSMGIANIVSGFLGGAPMCHGCGGLTAQHKFGARTERSGYIIGFAFLGLALFFGNSALSIISAFPSGILGVLLCFVGIQHALFIKDILMHKRSVLIAVIVATCGYMTTNLTIGFLVGMGIHYGLSGLARSVSYFAQRYSTGGHHV